MGAQGIRSRRIRAVNLRSIQKGSDGIDLLTRIGGPRLGIVIGASERHVTGGVERVAGLGRGDVERLAGVGGRQIQVVIEELPENVNEIGQPFLIDDIQVLRGVVRIGLIGKSVADIASAGSVGSGRSAGAVRIIGRSDPDQIASRVSPGGVERIVSGSVNGVEAGREQCSFFQNLYHQPPGPNGWASRAT